MTDHYQPLALSPRRGHLAGFENSYRVAVQRRRAGGAYQYVIRTGNPVQPFRVTSDPPEHDEHILALVA